MAFAVVVASPAVVAAEVPEPPEAPEPIAPPEPIAAPAESRQTLRVLLVIDRINDPLMARIQAEILGLGLSVATSAPTGPLEFSAREQHAAAAIRALPSRKGVELWMADITTGRTLARQLIVDERPNGPDQTVLAMQTAEILRTGLFPSREALPAPRPAPVVPIVTAPQPQTGIHLQAGIGALYSSGGVDTELEAWLSLQLQWRHRLGVALTLSGPLIRGSISGPEGSARVGAYLAGAELFSNFLETDSRWFLTGGLGGGIVNLRTKGDESTRPLKQSTSNSSTGVGYARAEYGLKLSKWARLSIAGTAGTTFVPVKIYFAGNQAGTWGNLLLASFLQLGVNW